MPSLVLQLEVLPKADLIITMADGRIAEIGSYDELLRADGAMAKLLAEHLAESQKPADDSKDGLVENPEIIALKEVHIQDEIKARADTGEGKGAKPSAKSGALIEKEERTIGAVGNSVYAKYIRSMGSLWVSTAEPLCLFDPGPLTPPFPSRPFAESTDFPRFPGPRTGASTRSSHIEQDLLTRDSRSSGRQCRHDHLSFFLERGSDGELVKRSLHGR
jgi:hypothetical protein